DAAGPGAPARRRRHGRGPDRGDAAGEAGVGRGGAGRWRGRVDRTVGHRAGRARRTEEPRMSDDRVRGFPAFGAGGHLARSWWGRAWVRAMEDTALDLRQLKKGRKYAAAGLVGPITISPGRIAAVVDDADGGPYR